MNELRETIARAMQHSDAWMGCDDEGWTCSGKECRYCWKVAQGCADAALEAAAPLIVEAALQPIRDALANHPRCEEHPDGDVISCGWKAAVLDVQRALEARDG